VSIPIRRFAACVLAMFAQGAASCSPSSAPSAGPDDGGSDGGPIGCPVTIDAYCASDGGSSVEGPCVRDWPTAMQNASQLCTGGTFLPNRVFVYEKCDGYDLIVVGETDTSTVYYYDPVTLDLVRIDGNGNEGSLCIAGQPGPIAPLNCFDATPTSICAEDGGPG